MSNLGGFLPLALEKTRACEARMCAAQRRSFTLRGDRPGQAHRSMGSRDQGAPWGPP